MMNIKGAIFRFSSFLFLFILLFAFACATPSWFPIKKGTPSKAKTKELVDKEVVIIDKEEYVKVYNPKASGEGNQPHYLYIPVNEYLAKKETFTSLSYRKAELKKEPASPTQPSLSSPLAGDQFVITSPKSSSPGLKKKVVVTHFDDRTLQADETFGDWIAERLIKEMDRRSQGVLFVDYQMVKEFLENRGIPVADLETANALRLLNEVFGIQALVLGHLAGPYTFVTKGDREREETASAIIKIEMKLIDTLTGRNLKNLEATNPILATKVQGFFSEEKARVKAIDVTLSNLIGPLSRELDSLDWFCRIAKIDGEDVYLNAGKLTGIKVGDIMEVFRPEKPGERGEIKGKIRISTCFGIDASIGNLIQGKSPEVDDILRLAKHEGT
ncbi:MAG: hypothetical protein A2156_00150 [Deltaproteobacteria bacterium RBG_16_48_10]|nr:MAG: hypothetical protein A2156_00150 [Deltaproteobacteria bacterium RBG_16_48_10]